MSVTWFTHAPDARATAALIRPSIVMPSRSFIPCSCPPQAGEIDARSSVGRFAIQPRRPKCQTEELVRQALPLFREHDRLRLRAWVHNPPLLVEKVHQVPVQAFPHATAVVKRQRDRIAKAASASLSASRSSGSVDWHGAGPL